MRRPRNIERAERLARGAMGAALVGAAVLLFPGGWWLGLLGIPLFLTGLAGWCPLYAWLAQD